MKINFSQSWSPADLPPGDVTLNDDSVSVDCTASDAIEFMRYQPEVVRKTFRAFLIAQFGVLSTEDESLEVLIERYANICELIKTRESVSDQER